jgi:hypothetical protein
MSSDIVMQVLEIKHPGHSMPSSKHGKCHPHPASLQDDQLLKSDMGGISVSIEGGIRASASTATGAAFPLLTGPRTNDGS